MDSIKKSQSYILENLPKIHPNYEVNQAEYYELLYEATKQRLNADPNNRPFLASCCLSKLCITLDSNLFSWITIQGLQSGPPIVI